MFLRCKTADLYFREENSMMIVWNEQSMRWFQDASEYTGYNKKLAGIILEHIPNRSTLCDMGCGAGLIDFELSREIGAITCIDISPGAIEQLKRGAMERGIKNITAICADAFEADGQWETVLALFHGGEDSFSKYFRLASDQLILVTHGSLQGGFGPENRRVTKCFDSSAVCRYLDGLGVKYHYEPLELEYGQPLLDLDDAREFVKAYALPMSDEELDAYIDENLRATGNDRFHYYLPKTRDMGFFVIRRKDNAQF